MREREITMEKCGIYGIIAREIFLDDNGKEAGESGAAWKRDGKTGIRRGILSLLKASTGAGKARRSGCWQSG